MEPLEPTIWLVYDDGRIPHAIGAYRALRAGLFFGVCAWLVLAAGGYLIYSLL